MHTKIMKSIFFTLMLFHASFGNVEQDYPQKPISLIHGFDVGGSPSHWYRPKLFSRTTEIQACDQRIKSNHASEN